MNFLDFLGFFLSIHYQQITSLKFWISFVDTFIMQITPQFLIFFNDTVMEQITSITTIEARVSLTNSLLITKFSLQCRSYPLNKKEKKKKRFVLLSLIWFSWHKEKGKKKRQQNYWAWWFMQIHHESKYLKILDLFLNFYWYHYRANTLITML